MSQKNSIFMIPAFLIPAAVSIVIAIAALAGGFDAIDWAVFDLCLRARAEPREDPTILLADFDDTAMAEVGTWPVGRDITADGLALLGELGARTVVFDIEYVDASPRGIDSRFLEENLPEYFNQGFGSLGENIYALFGALAEGQIPLGDAEAYIDDLVGLSDSVKEELLSQVRRVAADNDARLGRAALLMGGAYFTVNRREEPVPNASQAAEDLAMITAALPGPPIVDGSADVVDEFVDIWPTIPPILKRAAGAGFPNVQIDNDGVRRRIDLLFRYKDRLFAQLVFAPLLASYGSPTLELSKRRIRLIDAKLPSGEIKTIDIPLTEDGRMLIDWPHKTYADSFRHISFRKLIIHDRLFDDLTHNLKIRDDWGYFSMYDGLDSPVYLAERAQEYRRACLEEDGMIGEESKIELREMRDTALTATLEYLDKRPEDAIALQLQALLDNEDLDGEARSQYEFMLEDAPEYFEKTRAIAQDLARIRDELKRDVAGTFVITGWTSTGTTDIGVNPFDSEYVNVGTHAAVLNTINNESFLDDVPIWLPILIAAAASFGLALIIRGQPPLIEIVIGVVWVLIMAGVLVMIFIFTGRWIGPASPVIASALTFLISTIVSFLRTEREKGFLRNAFSHYLSSEVIREIVADPTRLKLGGTKKTMTALFTDIRGFSTVSEKLSPEDLVRLLNRYLTGMSDAILDLKGTIDKYEGDAIIAFFGAPLDLPDHAERGCLAAVQMKRIESQLNEKFLADGIAPSPLLTRVGINTGDMVVGNMGTDRKMDYTIIGDSVNLAARLEGVNKQYGTWICVSEDTQRVAGDSFLYRRLDRIRVVGKSQPIRIYELVEEKSKLDQRMIDFFGQFDEGMNLFEDRAWPKARDVFKAAMELKPDDVPAKMYIDRCSAFMKKPPAEDWDGVYNLTMK